MVSFIKRRGVGITFFAIFTISTAVIQYLTVLRYCRSIIPDVFKTTVAGRAVLPTISAFTSLFLYTLALDFIKGGAQEWERAIVAACGCITVSTSIVWTLGFIIQSIKSAWMPFYTFILLQIIIIVWFAKYYFSKYFSCSKEPPPDEEG